MLGKEVVAFWWFADSPVILLQCRMSQHNNVTIYFSLSPRYLIEQRDVDLNVRDKWDSTPL